MPTYRHVSYLWDRQKAPPADDQPGLLLYRSNLLGADLRITNFGGGNTSCKTTEVDPLTSQPVEVMWIKGSGGDLGTLRRNGIAGLYVDKLRALKNRYRGLEYEDEIVPLYYHCLFDPDSRAPSIDTALHGLLPFRHIDHLHPDAVIAIAAAKSGREIVRQVWGETMGWVPWQRPGFDLGLQLEQCLHDHPGIRGIVLGGHGLFTWADTSYDCYVNSLEVIEQAAQFIAEREAVGRPVFGGQKIRSLSAKARKAQAARLAPLLRGLCSSHHKMIGHFSDDEAVLQFINSNDLDRLAPLGTSCPDHFLRTKIQPLVLPVGQDADLGDPDHVKLLLKPAFAKYRQEYTDYYNSCKHPDSPPMRDPNPVVILYPGVGMFAFAKNKQTARVACEFYKNAINVMRGAEAISEYTALSRQEAFNIEYWLLEEAKLQRQPAEKPLSRHIALITGGGGGIGTAVAKKLVAAGANVVLTDVEGGHLQEALSGFGNDEATALVCDVTQPTDVVNACHQACLDFGGIDIVVHSAGLAIAKTLANTTSADWNQLQDVLVKGQFNITQQGVAVMRKQALGGNIINIASKNGLVAGKNNVAYGTAKAAQQHMTRLLAAELGPEQIRINTINPDGVITGSKIWEGNWAEDRARTHGITVEELPAFYAQRNLMNAIIRPEDVANAVIALLTLLDKSTGNMLNVDGGIPQAFTR